MCGNYLIEITIVPFLLTIVAIGLWIVIEWHGKPWHRSVAGGLLAVWIAVCGTTIATRLADARRSYENSRTKHASIEMLYAATVRMERGDCESLVADFEQMRKDLDRSGDVQSTIERTFLDFAYGEQ